MGITGTVSLGIGSFLSSFLVYNAYKSKNDLGAAFFLGLIFCIISSGVAIVLSFIDEKTYQHDKSINKQI